MVEVCVKLVVVEVRVKPVVVEVTVQLGVGEVSVILVVLHKSKKNKNSLHKKKKIASPVSFGG